MLLLNRLENVMNSFPHIKRNNCGKLNCKFRKNELKKKIHVSAIERER